LFPPNFCKDSYCSCQTFPELSLVVWWNFSPLGVDFLAFGLEPARRGSNRSSRLEPEPEPRADAGEARGLLDALADDPARRVAEQPSAPIDGVAGESEPSP